MLKNIIHFLKQYWLFIFLAAIASGLILLHLYQKTQLPTIPQITPTPAVSQSKLNAPQISGLKVPRDAKFNFTDFPLPTQLRTYQGKTIKFSRDEAQKIAKEFGFAQTAQESEDITLGTFLSWSQDNQYLSISLETGKIEYSLDLTQTEIPQEGSLSSPAQAQKKLESLLKKLKFEPQFETSWQKETYQIKRFYLISAPNPQEADFIRVGFNPKVDQYQLVGLNPHNSLVSLTLDKNENFIRFYWQINFESFEEKDLYQLKTQEEVKRSLFSEGKIVYSGTYQQSTKDPEIIKVEFNQIKLTYFQEPEKNPLIQPIYILSGQGTLPAGGITEIVTYLPAIASKWFKDQPTKNIEVKPLQEHFTF